MPRKTSQKIKKTVLAVGLSLMAVLFLLPMILTLVSSFMSAGELEDHYQAMLNPGEPDAASKSISLTFFPEQATVQNYVETLTQGEFLKRFWNSIILTVPITVLQTVLALFASYGFARYRSRLKQVLFFGFMILMLLPNQVMLVPQFLLGRSLGLEGSRWMVLLPGIFSVFPIYLLTRTFSRIPESYFEAAKLDGAGEFQAFLRIALPLCKSMTVSVFLLVFIDYWNMVEQPLLFLAPQQQPLSLFLSGASTASLGRNFAAAVLYMIPPLLLFVYGKKDLSKGISYSGTKEG